MDISFTGHNLDTTNSLKEVTTKKLNKLHRHFDKISGIDVTFNVEKLDHVVEATVRVPRGNSIHAKSTDSSMYAAIDSLINKLDKQLVKHKEKIMDH